MRKANPASLENTMMNRPWIMPTAIVVLGIVVGATAWQLAGALGRISVLLEEAEVLEEASAAAEVVTVAAVEALNVSFEAAEVERVEAAVALEEAQVEIDSQEAEAEASFRRAVDMAASGSAQERAIEEMRGEAIVTSMAHEAKEAESAAALFQAQQRIRTLGVLSSRATQAFDMERAAWAAERSIKDQIIAEQQNVIAPSFITKLFDMPEVALFGMVVGGGIAYAVTR